MILPTSISEERAAVISIHMTHARYWQPKATANKNTIKIVTVLTVTNNCARTHTHSQFQAPPSKIVMLQKTNRGVTNLTAKKCVLLSLAAATSAAAAIQSHRLYYLWYSNAHRKHSRGILIGFVTCLSCCCWMLLLLLFFFFLSLLLLCNVTAMTTTTACKRPRYHSKFGW